MQKVPTQVHKHIRQFVHTDDLNDIEETILAIENLLSRNKKFVLDFNSLEDLKFTFRPRMVNFGHDVMNATMIELRYEPEIPLSLSIIGKAYPFQDQSANEIREQKKWLVFFLYDLLQQFGVDPEVNEALLASSNANLTRKAFAQLLRSRRTINKADAPRWFKEFSRLIPHIRTNMRMS